MLCWVVYWYATRACRLAISRPKMTKRWFMVQSCLDNMNLLGRLKKKVKMRGMSAYQLTERGHT